jgi:hypothetical protein
MVRVGSTYTEGEIGQYPHLWGEWAVPIMMVKVEQYGTYTDGESEQYQHCW